MKLRCFVLPALCLAGAALLLAPLRSSRAFNKLNGRLGETQRDVRVFDNFLDATANDNTTPEAQFPGYTGAELAIWKAVVEWGSRLHGDGSGDPLNGNLLGSGGANFDAMWAGNASGPGGTNDNVVLAQPDCGGTGILANCELPIHDGWRIRFCDEYDWDDGPGGVGSAYDLQGIMAHEYGHALGLAHSWAGFPTMANAIAGNAVEGRSIELDDVLGVQCIYGIASATKPILLATAADPGAGTLTLSGTGFGATGNEVWFTSATPSAPGTDPIVRVTGVASTGGGTKIVVAIPAAAGPGDVMVNKLGTGGETLSNAFPTDLVGTFGTPPAPHPDITAVEPAVLSALVPGTAQTVVISGVDLDQTTSVTLDGEPIPAERWTIVSSTTLTLDMPQASSLGAHDLGVSDGSSIDVHPVTVVANATPTLQWGTGDPGNSVSRSEGLEMIVAGPVGQLQLVLSSHATTPTSVALASQLSTGAHGASLTRPGAWVVPEAGWVSIHIPHLPDPALVGASWFARSFGIVRPAPFPAGNAQSILLGP